jgi:hypothetical protein
MGTANLRLSVAFSSRTDLGGDRMDKLPQKTWNLRNFLNKLPQRSRKIVAYKAAWKLLFNEEI